MQVFKYYFVCGKCGKKYDPATETILAQSQEAGFLEVCKKHKHCPECGEPLSETTRVYLSPQH